MDFGLCKTPIQINAVIQLRSVLLPQPSFPFMISLPAYAKEIDFCTTTVKINNNFK